MDIKPSDKTIRDLLNSKRQFVIPRFQREYSWDKRNYKEFLEDMLGNLSVQNGEILPNPYFLGTMLFIGNFSEGTSKEIQIVDGQQRITTITILFSAMSEVLRKLGEVDLADILFGYIMSKDDNGKEVRILVSKTHYPYFAYFIQDKKKEHKQEPSSEEEICIKNAYDYFLHMLTEKRLKTQLCKTIGKEFVDSISLVDILKALRDQVLNTIFISISTSDEEQANRIFEILNAKGKRLAYTDLIKNSIFEMLSETEPADYAEEKWKDLKQILYSRSEFVGLATFYRHYWISKYKKSSENKLYDDFLSTKICATKEKSKNFVEDLITNANHYMQIISPNRTDYQNRKEYYWLVQSLNNINAYFGIVQTRIALLALFDLKQRSLISTKTFKATVKFLEGFHFAYNAVMSGRANKFEKIYSTFAIEVRKCTDKNNVDKIINSKLIEPLNKIYPTWEDFCSNFVKLSYSKEQDPSNVKTKYAINMLNCYYSNTELFDDDGSIEHINPENDDTIYIGNLILLEGTINHDAGELPYVEKIDFYKKSKYVWVRTFLEGHPTFTKDNISDRAIEMAKTYYTKILCRKI